MIIVEWGSSLVLGVKQIDDHHEHLVNLLNRCYGAVMLNDPLQELEAVVTELCDYTFYHFETERKLMDDFGYSEEAAHLAEHQKFTDSIVDFQGRVKRGESLIAVDVVLFLKDWLVNHIQKTDRAFAAFLKERGVPVLTSQLR